MSDGTLITLISLGVTMLFMFGVPVFLVIGYWVIGMSFVLELPLDNIGAALADVFTDGFALLAMPLFILTGDLINRSGIARRLSDFAYSCLGWIRGGLGMASLGACGLFAAISGSNSATTAGLSDAIGTKVPATRRAVPWPASTAMTISSRGSASRNAPVPTPARPSPT